MSDGVGVGFADELATVSLAPGSRATPLCEPQPPRAAAARTTRTGTADLSLAMVPSFNRAVAGLRRRRQVGLVPGALGCPVPEGPRGSRRCQGTDKPAVEVGVPGLSRWLKQPKWGRPDRSAIDAGIRDGPSSCCPSEGRSSKPEFGRTHLDEVGALSIPCVQLASWPTCVPIAGYSNEPEATSKRCLSPRESTSVKTASLAPTIVRAPTPSRRWNVGGLVSPEPAV